MSIFRRLWNGEHSLARTFWLFFVLGNIGAFIVAVCVAGGLLIAHARPFAFIAFAAIVVGYYLLSSVGVWQSATRYPYTRWWPGLAKLFIVLWGGRFAWALIDGGAERFVQQVMR